MTNAGAFGYGATATASNTIVIGNTAIASIGGWAGWTNSSDARLKRQIKEDVPGLAFVNELRPVTFTWDMQKVHAFEGSKVPTEPALVAADRAKETQRQTGFLAQEVEEAAKKAGFEFSGVVKPANDRSQYMLSYAEFVVPLVGAVQEQQKEIEQLRATVATLKAGEGRQRAGMLGDLSSVGMGLIGAAVAFAYSKRSRRS